MTSKTLAVIAALSLPLGSGCILLPNVPSETNCQAPRESAEGEVIRVKAPPQKIVIEQAECAPDSSKATCPETKGGSPESAKQPQRESSQRRPEAETAQPEVGLGSLASLGQIASLTRTTAMTHSLTTVNPGGSALGLGITWIHIPIPLPRLFSVDETPTVTVPLTEANLVATGFGDTRVSGGQQLTRRELAALVAQELAAQRCASPRNDTPAAPTQNDDAERRRLEKKLADAEAQIERMSKVLQSLDEKLTPLASPPKKPQ